MLALLSTIILVLISKIRSVSGIAEGSVRSLHAPLMQIVEQLVFNDTVLRSILRASNHLLCLGCC